MYQLKAKINNQILDRNCTADLGYLSEVVLGLPWSYYFAGLSVKMMC